MYTVFLLSMNSSIDINSVCKKISEGVDPIYAVPEDLTHIADGSERTVYRYDKDYVIKFSMSPSDSINQNVREKSFYDRVKNTPISHLFAEINPKTDNNKVNSYIIQEYINHRTPVLKSEIEEWVRKANEYNIEVHDDRPVNFGYRGNQLVMLDYAGCFFTN